MVFELIYNYQLLKNPTREKERNEMRNEMVSEMVDDVM